MRNRILLLLLLLALLAPVAMLTAQSSSSGYVMQRFVLVGGGSAESSGYKTTAVIGQASVGQASSANYKISSGFLAPIGNTSTKSFPIWIPVVIDNQ